LKRPTIAHAHQPKQQPLNKQRQTAITSPTPREDGHVPNRCRSERRARHTELRSRPCARCINVQVHSIGICTTCSDPRETATSCTAYTTKQQGLRPHASITQTSHHHPHASTKTAAPQQTASNCNYLFHPPRRWPRSQQMSQQDEGAPH
jgi:hypothetical protein